MELPKLGTKVVTKSELRKDTEGFLVAEKNLITRKPNAEGTYEGWPPGAGGDLWWIKHNDGSIAAYCFDELEVPTRFEEKK